MTSTDERLRRLWQIYRAGGVSMVLAFESELAAVLSRGDPRCVEPLLDFFDDGSTNVEVLSSILHAIESFPAREYLPALVRGTGRLYGRAPGWARTLYVRILNSEAYRESLAELLRAEADRAPVLDVLRDVETRSPQLGEKVRSVISLPSG